MRKSINKRVAHVVLHNAFAGAQSRLLSLVPGLAEAGIKNYFVLPKEVGRFGAEISALGEASYWSYFRPKTPTSISKIMSSVAWLLLLPVTIMRLRAYFQREDISVVHVNGLPCFHAAIAAKSLDIPVAWHLMSDFYPNWLVKVTMPFVSWIAETIIVISPQTSEYYRVEPNDGSVRLISEPVDVSKFIPENNINGRESVRIGTVGNVAARKGFHNLIEAFSNLLNEYPDAQLEIVGAQLDVEYQQQLDKQVRESNAEGNVHFKGGLHPRDVSKFLSALDLFALVSLSEGTPIAIMEAMATGLPVIATDVGGIASMIDHNQTGLLVPPNDVESIEIAIRRLIEHPKLRIKLGQQARESVIEKYSLDACLKAHLRMYVSLF